jgi:hypothetical protein
MASESSHEDENVSGEDVLYRRIPASIGAYNSNGLAIQAFSPNQNDTGGLSVSHSRNGRTAQDEGSDGRSGKEYYVAVIDRHTVEMLGIQLEDRPVEGNPSHIEIVQLTYEARRSPESKLLMQRLRDATIRVEGPFEGQRVVEG